MTPRPAIKPTLRSGHSSGDTPVPLQHAVLHVLPEVKSLDVEEERTLWTSVEISAAMDSRGESLCSLTPIDLLVVIDLE